MSSPVHGLPRPAHQEHQAGHAARHIQAAVAEHCTVGLGHGSLADAVQAEGRVRCYGWDRDRNLGRNGPAEARHSPDETVERTSRGMAQGTGSVGMSVTDAHNQNAFRAQHY